MTNNKFTNNASSVLATSITYADTTLIIFEGTHTLFPVIEAQSGNYFMLTVVSSDGNLEIMKVVATDNNVFTVERGQEGTDPIAFPTDSVAELRITAASLNNFISSPAVASELPVTTTLADTDKASDDLIPTEKAVRDAIASSAEQDDFFRYSRIGEVYTGSSTLANNPSLIVADGRTVDMNNYPELFAKIKAGHITVKTYDPTDTTYDGTWRYLSGSTATYYAPDFMGRVVKYFNRKDDDTITDKYLEEVGFLEEDAIRNISGNFAGTDLIAPSGAFAKNSGSASIDRGSKNYDRMSINFSASKVVATADQNRVKSVYQLPLIYMGNLASK